MSDNCFFTCILVCVLSVCYTVGGLSVYYSDHPGGPDDCYYHGSDDLSGMDLMQWLQINGIWVIAVPTVQAGVFFAFDNGAFMALGIEVLSSIFYLIMFGMGMSLITKYTEDSCKQTPGWDMALAILIFQGVAIFNTCLRDRNENRNTSR